MISRRNFILTGAGAAAAAGASFVSTQSVESGHSDPSAAEHPEQQIEAHVVGL